jgi:hypothetical protein
VPETGRLTESLMLPVPDAVQVAPPAATHVHEVPVNVAGNVSVIVTPFAFDGPAFVATIV